MKARHVLISLMCLPLLLWGCEDETVTSEGCNPDVPAMMYAAGPDGSTYVAPPAGEEGPMGCLELTGYGSADAGIGITGDGTIVYAPAFNEARDVGVLYSEDNGATWDMKVPLSPEGLRHSRLNTYLHVDTISDNVIFSSDSMLYNLNVRGYEREDYAYLRDVVQQARDKGDELVGGFHVSTSMDKGETWTYNNLDPTGLDCPKLFSGPPTADGPQPVGHPTVSYFMSPTPLDEPIPPAVTPTHESIYRSLDGGESWEKVSEISLLFDDNDVSRFEWVQYGVGIVDHDGVVYLGYRRGDQLAMAVSYDEGVTWIFRDVTGITLENYSYIVELADFGFNNYNWNAYISDVIALDSEGNLYAVAVDTDSIVKMAYSKDKGVTWSTPVVVSAPGKKVFFSAMAVKEPGTLAVAYYGSGDGSKWNGYIAETTNAFDENPVFWSVTANDPADPLHPDSFSTGWFGAIWGMDINEEIHMKYAPNGDVWVSFMKEMCNQRSQCIDGWDYEAHGNSRYQGAAGRLTHRSLDY